MMMYIGAFLFLMIFAMMMPQTHAALSGATLSLGLFMDRWAPFSYLMIMLLVAMLFAGLYVIQSWPKHVEPENPMAKYRREAPMEED